MSKTIFYFILFLPLCTILNAQTSGEKIQYIQAENAGDQELPFSQAVRVGNMLYLSGMIGSSKEAGGLVEGGIIPETRQILKKMKAVLEKNGSSMDQVIKCTCMLADIAEWGKMNSEYVKFFPKHKPARSAFGASGLALGARVEIECMAYVD